MKPWFFERNNDEGMVTFPVLMICISMLVSMTTILSVLMIRFQLEFNRGKHQVIYEAVKSVAVATLHEISGGVRPGDRGIPVGNVEVNTSVTGSDVVTVQVSGVSSGEEDTVRFTYDTIRKKVTDWKENIPPQ